MAHEIIAQSARDAGFPELKDKQKEAIKAFLEGNDLFVSLPTGYGKSVIYAILPFVFDRMKGASGSSIVLCVSPLTAIMVDQCEKLQSLGMAADYVGEAQEDKLAVQRVIIGQAQLVFISPEAIISNPKYRQMLSSSVYKEKLVAVAVDEAHLVKEWGDSFRTTFAELGQLRSIVTENVHVMALTATATKDTLEVVIKRLSLNNPVIIGLPPGRDNTMFRIETLPTMEKFCTMLAGDVRIHRTHFPKTIIFCQTYPDCANMFHLLKCKLGHDFTDPPGYPSRFHQFRLIDMYNRASKQDMKEKVLSSFRTAGSKLRIVIATTAFSLGVDCPDINHVMHYGTPTSIHQYVQETGRAGRDGQQSYATLLHGKAEHAEQSMKAYAEGKTCRRKVLFKNFLFFNSNSTIPNCKCCDVCNLNHCNCTNCT